jgi:hypothetical protein
MAFSKGAMNVLAEAKMKSAAMAMTAILFAGGMPVGTCLAVAAESGEKTAPSRFSWQEKHAQVLPSGNLELG